MVLLRARVLELPRCGPLQRVRKNASSGRFHNYHEHRAPEAIDRLGLSLDGHKPWLPSRMKRYGRCAHAVMLSVSTAYTVYRRF